MASNNGKRSSAPGNNSSLVLGILIGMVLGLAVAGAVAWHLSKRPNTFASKESREPREAAPTSDPTPAPKAAATPKPPVAAQAAAPVASGVGDGKPRFEFYKILADKDGTPPKTSGHSNAAAAAPKAAPKAASTALLLQAGSFASAGEADRLKARLALLGMEATVQSANVAGKGTYYRVRLGPYHTSEELNKANSTLKQNGINDAAQVRAQ